VGSRPVAGQTSGSRPVGTKSLSPFDPNELLCLRLSSGSLCWRFLCAAWEKAGRYHALVYSTGEVCGSEFKFFRTVYSWGGSSGLGVTGLLWGLAPAAHPKVWGQPWRARAPQAV
jgi:hypothetical protein